MRPKLKTWRWLLLLIVGAIVAAACWALYPMRWRYFRIHTEAIGSEEWVEFGRWIQPSWFLFPGGPDVYVVRWHRRGRTAEYVLWQAGYMALQVRATPDRRGFWVTDDRGDVVGSLDRRTGEVLGMNRTPVDARLSRRRQIETGGGFNHSRPQPAWATPSGGVWLNPPLR